MGLGLDPRTVGGLLSELPRLLGAGREELNEALRMRGVKPLGQRLKVGISLAEHRRASQANLTAYSGSQIMHAQRAAPPPPPPPSDVSAKELGKILRGEVNALDTPVVLTKHAGDGPSAAEAAHVRARVVEAGSGTGTDARNGGCSTLFSLVDGMAVSGKPVVGVSAGSDEVLGLWTRGLCECGDPKCGCNRLSHPAVRRDFRDRVGQHTASALQQPRAASDGNGLTRGGGGAASLGGAGGVGAVLGWMGLGVGTAAKAASASALLLPSGEGCNMPAGSPWLHCCCCCCCCCPGGGKSCCCSSAGVRVCSP